VATKHFSPRLFSFLRDLAEHNERAWFKAQKKRYEEAVKEPCLAFVRDIAEPLGEVSDYLVADPRPVGGSMFRIHRDTRFSKDKTPYKTHAALHFRHEAGKDVHAPGIYVHLEPRNCFFGAGMWRPDTASRRAVHEHILADPDRWRAAVQASPFVDHFELAGDSLKRPPTGVDPEHPLVEDLKRKDFIATCSFTQGEVTSGAFLDLVIERSRQSAPLLRFLCDGLDVGF